jgi:hypothetical protein
MKTPEQIAANAGHDKLAKALRKGTIGSLLRKESVKRNKARRADTPMDMERAMNVWNAFFENAMKANELRSRDDFDTGRKSKSRASSSGYHSSQEMLFTPRSGVPSAQDSVAAARRLQVQQAREEKEEKARLLEQKRARNLREREAQMFRDGKGGNDWSIASPGLTPAKTGKKKTKQSPDPDPVQIAVQELRVWTRIMDAESSQVYYYDEETGESVWEEPSLGVTSAYVLMHDGEYGRDFYFDDESGRSYWTWPPPEEEEEEEEEEEGGGGGQEHEEEKKGGEEEQKEEEGKQQEVEEPAPAQLQEAADPLTWQGWLECFDPSSNPYYINNSTLETSWAIPDSTVVMLYDADVLLHYFFFLGAGKSLWSISPWRCVVDADTEAHYFTRMDTGESKWELDGTEYFL